MPVFNIPRVRDYKEHARAAIKEMHRQMGDSLVFGEDGLLKRGLMIRLLVLPNDIAGIADNLRWIRDELSPKTAISLMAQYYRDQQSRDRRAIHFALAPHLRRRMVPSSRAPRGLGMEEGFMQEYESASHYYRPDFTDREKPFKDIRDFEI